MPKVKALVLLSGGLDSILAARILMEQGVEVTGLSFKSNFFDTGKAKKSAEQLGIKLIEIDFSDEHLEVVKNPAHGYGKNMNPCIDCHALMLKKAKEIMNNLPTPTCKEGEYDFVATGEVLGQRPMSQRRDALKIVEKISRLEGKLVRPMSAKLLDESEPEKQGKLIRGKLLDISGRSRNRQLELVKKYGIKEYASPGGGCLLTDPEFSKKLLTMLECWPDCNGNDIELLKCGRVNWVKSENDKNILLVIGRDEKDNENLEKLAGIGDIIIQLVDENGPTSLIRSKILSIMEREIREINVPEELKMSELKFGEKKSEEEIIELAARFTGYYATKSRGKKIKLKIHKV
ncbi:tRNA 4-thiouridine(8) synthase ThiI [Patescibacteria group bacterium]|nr:tRNA 4-thiouridine(8) synthase ThiI [Patescibacteria group bacterium]MBU1663555.1 tRNA 4-thiouridine(8) synthase ThiI [Patescibacteria group bacterium]MBU1934207.1 tRNA 4-thiouridine(8) synthase ThiI [Patescibacteria group bacterium]MBU2007579.1 tRNA 4-thiouridine(8) synthase ThiI [Patescibacteria group bacterium]MBU2233791.1 tRNA 4-thiouridine(8) synthase ThiI [Patescibacteria group bacterium]